MTDTTERRPSQKRLSKQNEIDQGEQEDSSPNSDQSESTVTAGPETPAPQSSSTSPESPTSNMSVIVDSEYYPKAEYEDSDNDDEDSPHSHSGLCKGNKLQRSKAVLEEELPLHDDTLHPPSSTLRPPMLRPCKIEKAGSESSEAGTSSSLSRDSSVDAHYTDSTGIDLEEFIKMTLNRTPRDRQMLLQLEKDLLNFIKEPNHQFLKFPPMSSYNRMLVHRVAAYFGLDHNVDQSGKAVIVNKTNNTREPDFSFSDHIRNNSHSETRIVLKRKGASSLDESLGKSFDKGMLSYDKRTKSLEERQITYQQTRARIFQQQEANAMRGEPLDMTLLGMKPNIYGSYNNSKEDMVWRDVKDRPWSSTDSSGYSTDTSIKSKLAMAKASSVGDTNPSMLARHSLKAGPTLLNKSDSMSSGASSLGSPLTRPPFMPSSPEGGTSPTPLYPGHMGSTMMPSPMYWWPTESPVTPTALMLNPQNNQPSYLHPDSSMYRYPHMHTAPHCTTQGGAAANVQPMPVYPQPAVIPMDRSQYAMDASASKDLCQQMASLSMIPQGSGDMMGEQGMAGTMQTYTPMAAGHNAQHIIMPQGACYPGGALQAQSPMRYMYPSTFASPATQTQMPGGADIISGQHQVPIPTQPSPVTSVPFPHTYMPHPGCVSYSMPTSDASNSGAYGPAAAPVMYPVDAGMSQYQYPHGYNAASAYSQQMQPGPAYYSTSSTQPVYSFNTTPQFRPTSPTNQMTTISANQNAPMGGHAVVPMPTPVPSTNQATSPGHPGLPLHPSLRPHLHTLQFPQTRARIPACVAVPSPIPAAPPSLSPSLNKSRAKKTSLKSAAASTEKPGGQIYEIYNFASGLHRGDGDQLFEELVSIGANIQYLPRDSSNTLSVYLSDFTVLAIFSTAPPSDVLAPHLNGPRYKLRATINSTTSSTD